MSVEFTKKSMHSEEKLILFDLDGTLIDKSYQLTDEGIYAKLEEAQEDWVIGLSSDTPYEVMSAWQKNLQIDGPILSERGAQVAYGDRVQVVYEDCFDFRSYRDDLVEKFRDHNHRVWVGNATEFIRSEQQIGEPGESVVLVNDLRQYSTSFFVRSVASDGKLQINRELTESVAAVARSLFPDAISLDEDLNHEYGIFIASAPQINKRLGSLAMTKMFGFSGFIMVGDSMGDYVGEDLALQYAVGNASEEYKEHAVYIADKPITSGCIEILDMLIRDRKSS